MAKTSRLYDRTYKKTFKDCIIQLKSMLLTNGINTRQKIFIFNLLEDLRTQPMQDSENSSNIEVKNLWGQKDLHTVLKDRNDRIYSLENELECIRNENSRFTEESKRVKTGALAEGSTEAYRQMIAEKNNEIVERAAEIDASRSLVKELESKLSLHKDAIETLREANKRLLELTSKKPVPVASRGVTQEVDRLPDSDEEISRLKAENSVAEVELAKAKQSNSLLEEQLQLATEQLKMQGDRLKVAGMGERISSANDTEAALVEELESIVTAYDQIVEANRKLEESHTGALRRLDEVQTECMSLKSRVRVLEDSKQHMEREKRRLREWRESLEAEAKGLEERVMNYEQQGAEKDKKLSDYKALLTTLEANVKMVEGELSATAVLYRQTQGEVLALRKDTKAFQIEHDDMRRVCETYKGICTADINIVEEVERYKRILRCSLCDTNIKNSVISKCMHTFCDSCLNDRIRARQRKCPSCQVEFSSADIKKVYL